MAATRATCTKARLERAASQATLPVMPTRRQPSGGMPSGLVSLRRFVGSRNRPLAALALGGQRSFAGPRALIGAGFAGAVLVPAAKHLGRPGRPVAGPSCAARAA